MNRKPARLSSDLARLPGSDPGAASTVLDELDAVSCAALQWSVRLGDDCAARDRADFDAWFDAAPAHREAFHAISADLAEVDAVCAELSAEDIAGLRARNVVDRIIEGRIQPRTLPPPGPAPVGLGGQGGRVARAGRAGGEPAPRPTPARQPSALALTALAVTALCGGWVTWHQWYYSPLYEHQFTTQRGQQLNTALPDGSRVLLDTATSAAVTLYRNRREVRVAEGQALFEVSADTARPFEVLAGATRVTVTGTRFTVRHAPSLGTDEVEVAVLEGRVRVAPQLPEPQRGGEPPQPHSPAQPLTGAAASVAAADRQASAVMLGAGQTVVSNGQGQPGPVRTVAPSSIGSWREQRLVFDDVPLASVLAEIERYQPTGIRLQGAAVGKLGVTASVDLRNLAGFLRNLPAVLPVRISRHGDGSREVSLRD